MNVTVRSFLGEGNLTREILKNKKKQKHSRKIQYRGHILGNAKRMCVPENCRVLFVIETTTLFLLISCYRGPVVTPLEIYTLFAARFREGNAFKAVPVQ